MRKLASRQTSGGARDHVHGERLGQTSHVVVIAWSVVKGKKQLAKGRPARPEDICRSFMTGEAPRRIGG